MYLFHVMADPSTRNTPLTGTIARPNPSQALGLTLYYLLSAYARDNATQEQQAMSIGLKALHERGTYELLTGGVLSYDDANRLFG